MKSSRVMALVAGVLLIGIGGADLAFGNTNQPVLPSFIANNLSQNLDLVLIVGGGALVFFVH